MGTTNRLKARRRRVGIKPFTRRDASLEIDRLTVRAEAAEYQTRNLLAKSAADAETICRLSADLNAERGGRVLAEEEANALRWQLSAAHDDAYEAAEKSSIEFWESVDDDATAI